MAACKCPGCGGYGEWKAQQAAELAQKRERFEQWLAEQECGCGHTRAEHFGACRGTGATLDSQYGIPADQPCACTGFEALQPVGTS